MKHSDLVKRKFENDEFVITFHCSQRMDERTISINDIRAAGCNGRIIEVQKLNGERVLVQGKTSDGADFYMVVALERPKLVVVTVYRGREEGVERGR